MIVWGSGNKVINCGSAGSHYCEVCEKERQFNVILQYSYWGVYWIFSFVTEKQYLLLCDICSRGVELENKKVESGLGRVPIPFMRRFGCLIFIGGFITIGIIGSAGGC